MPGAAFKMEKKLKRNGAAVLVLEADKLATGVFTRGDQYTSLKGRKSSKVGGGVADRVADPPAQLLNGETNDDSFVARDQTALDRAAEHWCQESRITENGNDGDNSLGIGSLQSISLLHGQGNGNESAKNASKNASHSEANSVTSKRKRVEDDLKVGESPEEQPVKSVKLSEEARVWQYVCRRSVYVSPPLRAQGHEEQVPRIPFSSFFQGESPPSRGRVQRGRGGLDHVYNNSFFKEKTAETEVIVNHNIIKVTLTRQSKVVQAWIEQQSATHFGLDLEWQPNRRKGQKDNKVALLQISTETECLLVQMLFLDSIPDALVQLLKDPKRTIAGVGIHEDTKKLYRDYRLVSGGEVELTTLAVTHFKNEELKRAGLKVLAEHVLGFTMTKSKTVTMSNWSRSHLDRRQVEYACMDAWVSLAIFGRLQKFPVLGA